MKKLEQLYIVGGNVKWCSNSGKHCVISSLKVHIIPISSVQFSSVTESCPTLCNPMDCSIPGFLGHHQILELTQTYVHWVSDAIQPSHPLVSPSPPAFNHSQHQGLFQQVHFSPRLAKVLEFQLQHQFFQWIFPEDGLVRSPCSPRDSQESFPTLQFKSIDAFEWMVG